MANHGRLIVIALFFIQCNVFVLSMHQVRPDDEYFVRNSQARVASTNQNSATQSQQFYQNAPIIPPVNHLLPPPESTEPNAPTCKPSSFGRHPIPNDCSKYLRCWNGHPEIIACRNGMMFNSNTKLCERAANVRCVNQLQPTEELVQEHISRQSSSRMIDFQTPPQSHSGRQVEELEVHEFGNMQCQRSSGLEPHPDDCNKFLNCVHGNGVVQECGPGTVFNEALQVCDWPYNVDCNRNGGTVYGDFSLDVRSDRSESADVEDEFHVRPTLSADRLNAIRNYALDVKPLREAKSRINQNSTRQNPAGEYGTHYETDRVSSVNNIRRRVDTAPGYDEVEDQKELRFGHGHLDSSNNEDHGKQAVRFSESANTRNEWVSTHERDRNYEPFPMGQKKTTEVSVNQNLQTPAGHYVHQTTPINPFDDEMASSQRYNQRKSITTQSSLFDNQLSNSQRYNKHRQRSSSTEVPQSTTPISTSIHQTVSRFDQEYQKEMEQRIRNRNFVQEVKITSTVPPPSLYLRPPALEEPEVAASDQWGFLTVTQTQRQPLTADQRQYNIQRANGEVNSFVSNQPRTSSFPQRVNTDEDSHQVIQRRDDIQQSYAAVRQANSFASHPHETAEAKSLVPNHQPSDSSNLLSIAEEGNQRRTVTQLSTQPQPINAYAMPSEWNIDPANPTTIYSNPPTATQFNTVDAAELEASLRILDSYTAPATSHSPQKQHITPIYSRSTMGRYYKHHTVNIPASSTESAKIELPADVNAAHISEAIQMMLRPYLKGVSATTTEGNVATTENTTNTRDSDLPSYRISASRNDLDQTAAKVKTEGHKGHKWSQSAAQMDVELLQPSSSQECQFNCRDNGLCVEHSKVCNGVNDCGNYLDEQHCPNVNYQIRLSSNSSHKGLLEVHINSMWGLVCDSQFSINEANVACKELGFPLGAVKVLPDVLTDSQPITPRFQMDSVKCLGHETSLKQCSHLGWGVHNNCSYGQAVGLVCNDPSAAVMKCPAEHWLCEKSDQCIPYSFMCDGVPDCDDNSDEDENRCQLAFRLADNSTVGESIQGRIEVRNKGVWGTVCSNQFGEVEAKVFCRSIGLNGISSVTTSKQTESQETEVPIWLDNVNCKGKELSLDKCIHNDFGVHNCVPKSNAFVKCSRASSRMIHFSKDNSIRNSNVRPNANDLPGKPTITLPQYCGIVQVRYNNDNGDDVNTREGPVYRVVAGKLAKRGHHPWQASIRVNGLRGGSSHECGATVITARHIVTAGHCVSKYGSSFYSVRVGDHMTDIADPGEREIPVKRLHIHPEFRKLHTSNNDIAIVELQQPIEFNQMVQPICLPSAGAMYREGAQCAISGWGSIQTGVSGAAKELRSAQVPIIADEICRQDNVYGNNVTENMFCAGDLHGKSVDACGGDSGGPFACEEHGIHRLYGIISWGFRCGEENKPGVYVKTAKYIGWINNVIGNTKL